MIWFLIFVIIFIITEESSLIRKPCIVDSAFQNRFNEDNLIVTVKAKVYEMNIPGLTIVKEGLIDDYWPETRNATGRISIATSIGIELSLLKNRTRFSYKCLVSYDNCSFSYSRISRSSDWNIVAGLYYQPGMAVETQNMVRIASGESGKKIFAGFPVRGKECLECIETGCTYVNEREIHYKSYEEARKDPMKDNITAISVSWNNETQKADFFVFLGYKLRYTTKGKLKEVDLSSMLCPISPLKVVTLLLFLLCVFAIITLSTWSSITIYRRSPWSGVMQETSSSMTSVYQTKLKA